jgi:NifB/MoaA-like Fe-S oxidoreductase
VNYIPIENNFYGKDEVTVTGLLTGGDIVQQLQGQDLGEKVIFSDRIVNETSGAKTLDDLTLIDISNEIGVPFLVTPDEPKSFFEIIQL